MKLYNKVFIDKRLPQDIIDSGGFTEKGYRYTNLFYHYWRDESLENLYLIIASVPSIFINSKFINSKCIELTK